jgi:PqqD family protein of HPr-rel-A system
MAPAAPSPWGRQVVLKGTSRKTGSTIQRWTAARHLVWTQYDDGDEWVVYDPFSADIHLLTSSARFLWILVSDERPHSIDDLVATLAAELGRPADDELTTVTRETLSSMDRAGLLRPMPL